MLTLLAPADPPRLVHPIVVIIKDARHVVTAVSENLKGTILGNASALALELASCSLCPLSLVCHDQNFFVFICVFLSSAFLLGAEYNFLLLEGLGVARTPCRRSHCFYPLVSTLNPKVYLLLDTVGQNQGNFFNPEMQRVVSEAHDFTLQRTSLSLYSPLPLLLQLPFR